MASNEVISPYHLLQCSFATGEISEDVANRVDLDKYQAALTVADNCLIRPHGPVYKRTGTKYFATSSGSDHKLVSFSNSHDSVDYLLDFRAGAVDVYKSGVKQATVNTSFAAAYINKLRFTQSADTLFIASGAYPVKKLVRNSDTSWTFSDFAIDEPYFDNALLNGSDSCKLTPSGTSGTVTITSSEGIFSSSMVGHYIQLTQDVPQQQWDSDLNQVTDTHTSGKYWVGGSWKIVTVGTWIGYVKLEYSRDNGATWKQYRKWTNSSKHAVANYTESGTPAEGMWMRCIAHTDYKDNYEQEVTFTVESYNKVGYGRITAVGSSTSITASVSSNNNFGTTEYTTKFAISAWGGAYGYPMTCCFFQDRLCFGGTNKQPYMLWMSRTGDYPNFGVEKVDGKVTDDSAVALSFVSRRQFAIKHLVPSTDLIIYTQGNEWILSGNEVVSPSSATPKMQTTRGCGDIEPVMIGSKTVFVQGRGNIVRDMGYSYDIDAYGGMDLTLLNKDIIDGIDIVDFSYMQEPNSAIYFVRSDGTIAILTYVIDQKVYAWSTFRTSGKILNVCAVAEGDRDTMYAIVKRTVNGSTVYYLEAFQHETNSNVPNDHIMLDCASVSNSNTATSTLTAAHLKGLKVSVLGDGREFKNISVNSSGTMTLPTTVKKAVIGLPYSMTLELPNVEIKGRDGTTQGRLKTVSEVIVRLNHSLGGTIGPDTNTMDAIHYDEFQNYESIKLYSGDKKVQMPIGGFNTNGRVSIVSNDAYPFDLAAVVREVSLGG